MPKERKTALQRAASALGKKAGAVIKAKYGKAHFKMMANARWHPEKKK